MVFNIIYKDRTCVMFDIDYWLKIAEWSKDERYSDISVTPIVDGIVRYIHEHPDINIEEFIADATEIQELRRWLFEINGNKSSEDHYGTRYTELKTKIYGFAVKYELEVNVD